MAIVTTRGIGPWKKTIVEHAGKTEVFSGNAEVTKHSNGTVCVAEQGFFTSKSACYMDSEKKSPPSGSLPDGTLVGKSKSITIETRSGERKTFESSPLSINSMEKSGNEVKIVKNGIFGSSVVEVIKASDISKIESSDCHVCKSLNPVYQD